MSLLNFVPICPLFPCGS